MTEDVVNHPKHYTEHPSGVECITITEHMNFNLGNALKYIWRASLKGKQVEDLKKAQWYLTREIERLDGKAGNGVFFEIPNGVMKELKKGRGESWGELSKKYGDKS